MGKRANTVSSDIKKIEKYKSNPIISDFRYLILVSLVSMPFNNLPARCHTKVRRFFILDFTGALDQDIYKNVYTIVFV